MFYNPDGRSADGRRIYEKGGKGGGNNNAVAEQAAKDRADARADEEVRKAEIRDTRAEVDRHFTGFNEPYFQNISDSYLRLNAPLLSEQAAKARHDLPYKFARTDNSDYQRVLAELETDQAREEANLKDKALDVANTQRATVEKNRADLVQLANSGTDAGSIATQSANRAASIAKPETFSPIADLFSKYAQNYALASQVGGGPEGRTFARPLTFPSSRSAVTNVGG